MKSSQSISPGEGIFNCGRCDQSIAIDVRAAGMEVNCPYCEDEIVIPSFTEASEALSGAVDVSDDKETSSNVDQSSVTGSLLPAPRKKGELPRAPVPDEKSGGYADYRVTSSSPSPIDSVSLISAIARGEVGILKAQKVGRRRVLFGCPFCAKPIDIKLKQQGRELKCKECSGVMIAPHHDAGIEAKMVSGRGGVAGVNKVDLPNVKTDSSDTDFSPNSQSVVKQSQDKTGSSTDRSEHKRKPSAEQPVRYRLNHAREVRLVPRDAVGTDKDVEDMDARMKGGFSIAKKLRLFAVVIMSLSMLGIVAMSLMREDGINEREVSLEQYNNVNNLKEKSGAKDAISLCSEFSLLTTVNQRLKYIRHPNESINRMQRHYAGVLNSFVFPPLNVKSYQENVVNGIRFARMTSLAEEGERQREFFFEVTDTGLLLDWESAVGFCDVDVMEYSSAPSFGPVQMRVLVKPADYFAFAFKDADRFDCYEITDLTSRIRIHGYVETGSAHAQDMRGLHPGEGKAAKGFVYCTLLIRAHESVANRNSLQVTIENLVQDSWLLP